ncbi:MAG: hypothetical protein KAS74_02550, partial [Methanosarcinales archaeon]|nr:hypothetical protein [Methanosarcinales archaeon]
DHDKMPIFRMLKQKPYEIIPIGKIRNETAGVYPYNLGEFFQQQSTGFFIHKKIHWFKRFQNKPRLPNPPPAINNKHVRMFFTEG